MPEEHSERLKAIAAEAWNLESAALEPFLRLRCEGDEEMLREVRALLARKGEASVQPLPVAQSSSSQPPQVPVQSEAPALWKDRYVVERELGRGGMSVVYLARDRQLLDKKVVIKVLLDESSKDPWMRQKFQQEMEALSRIDHPGVVGVLDTGLTEEGKHFLVVQYIEGATLRSAIEAGGMTSARAAGLIREIGQALRAAHEKGVWHRDLKPDNIMLQCLGGEEHIKLIDFGIAGIQDSQFTGEKTKVAGSLSYMAPEQLGGHSCAASDTYALAVVACELLTGRTPFPPDSMIHLVAEDTSQWIRLGDLRSDLPVAAERSLMKAMSFRPEARYASVSEFSEELSRILSSSDPTRKDNPKRLGKPTGTPAPNASPKVLWTVGVALVSLSAILWWGRSGRVSPTQERPSIAVLPFVDRSPEKNQEYFSDGMAEQLLNSLARIDGIRVVGRTSSFRFRDTSDDPRSIGRKLNVASILEGSVSRQSNRARINVQLIKTSDGFNLWSNSYNKDMSDIFEVQDAIASAVTESLKVTLLGKKGSDKTTRSTNADAYNAYLQGRYFLRRNDKEGLGRAVDYFEQAIKTDRSYPLSWAGIAKAHTNQFVLGYRPIDEGYQDARKEIETALALDANLGEVYEALGRIKMWHDWDWTGADAAYQRALVLEPGKSSVISNSGKLARILGRFGESAALLRRAIQSDPLDDNAYHSAGVAFYYAGLREEATAAFRKALELVPAREQTHSMLAEVYLGNAQPQEALAEARQEKNASLQLWGMALAYYALGRTSESDASLAELISKFGYPFVIAEVYAFRGDRERAFEWLDRAYAERDSGITLINGDPLLHSLTGDLRYIALLKKLKLPAVTVSKPHTM